jgi:hypothetical protein
MTTSLLYATASDFADGPASGDDAITLGLPGRSLAGAWERGAPGTEIGPGPNALAAVSSRLMGELTSSLPSEPEPALPVQRHLQASRRRRPEELDY